MLSLPRQLGRFNCQLAMLGGIRVPCSPRQLDQVALVRSIPATNNRFLIRHHGISVKYKITLSSAPATLSCRRWCGAAGGSPLAIKRETRAYPKRETTHVSTPIRLPSW